MTILELDPSIRQFCNCLRDSVVQDIAVHTLTPNYSEASSFAAETTCSLNQCCLSSENNSFLKSNNEKFTSPYNNVFSYPFSPNNDIVSYTVKKYLPSLASNHSIPEESRCRELNGLATSSHEESDPLLIQTKSEYINDLTLSSNTFKKDLHVSCYDDGNSCFPINMLREKNIPKMEVPQEKCFEFYKESKSPTSDYLNSCILWPDQLFSHHTLNTHQGNTDLSQAPCGIATPNTETSRAFHLKIKPENPPLFTDKPYHENMQYILGTAKKRSQFCDTLDSIENPTKRRYLNYLSEIWNEETLNKDSKRNTPFFSCLAQHESSKQTYSFDSPESENLKLGAPLQTSNNTPHTTCLSYSQCSPCSQQHCLYLQTSGSSGIPSGKTVNDDQNRYLCFPKELESQNFGISSEAATDVVELNKNKKSLTIMKAERTSYRNTFGYSTVNDVAFPKDFNSKAELVAYVAHKLESMVESFTFKSATYQMYLKQFLPRPEEKQRRYIERIDAFPRIPTSATERRELCRLRNVQCGVLSDCQVLDPNGLTIKERLDDILTSLVNKIMFLLVVEFDTWYIHAPARKQIREGLLNFIWPDLPHLHSFFRDHFSLFIEMRIRHFRDSVARYFRDRPSKSQESPSTTGIKSGLVCSQSKTFNTLKPSVTHPICSKTKFLRYLKKCLSLDWSGTHKSLGLPQELSPQKTANEMAQSCENVSLYRCGYANPVNLYQTNVELPADTVTSNYRVTGSNTSQSCAVKFNNYPPASSFIQPDRVNCMPQCEATPVNEMLINTNQNSSKLINRQQSSGNALKLSSWRYLPCVLRSRVPQRSSTLYSPGWSPVVRQPVPQ